MKAVLELGWNAAFLVEFSELSSILNLLEEAQCVEGRYHENLTGVHYVVKEFQPSVKGVPSNVKVFSQEQYDILTKEKESSNGT